ncbi:PREDICTED: centromere protein T, partial [Merops nubicus]
TASDLGKWNRSGRSTLVKQRPTALPDLDNATPRLMLKRIIQTQPQVSPLEAQIPQHEETEEARSEFPSKRASSMGEMQLPDLLPEEMPIPTFHMAKKRKKLSISEFERAADKRLPQNQAQSTLDSTALARSLRMSLGSLIPPDTVEKRGLLRRPKNRRVIDMEAFEGGVEQNILKRKAENYLVDSPSPSGIQTVTLTSDAEIMLSNTELFVQPPFDMQSQTKLPAPKPQLSDSKNSTPRSKTSDTAQEEARLVGLVSSMGINERKNQRYSADLTLNREHVDGMTHVSPKTPANQQKDKQDDSQQSHPVEQLSLAEAVVVGTAEHRASTGYAEHLEKTLSKLAEWQITTAQDARVETEAASSEEGIAEGGVEHQGSSKAERKIAKDVGAGSLSRHSLAFSSEKSGMKPLEEAVEEGDELEDQAIMVELDGPEEEPTEDEDENSEEVSMKTPSFVHAAASQPQLSAPCPASSAASKFPLQLLQAKPPPKSSGASRRKTHEPEVASSLIKKIFSHYVKMPVTRDAFKIVEKCSERFFKQLSNDLEAYTNHAGRKTVEMADLEVLMRRQRLVTDKMPLHVLIEHYLPLEYRKLLIPVAVSGNKVIPCHK